LAEALREVWLRGATIPALHGYLTKWRDLLARYDASKAIPQSGDAHVPLAPGVVRYNGGTRCDMERGPCSCGAWHSPQSGTVKEGT
jgi:hypothetical protein